MESFLQSNVDSSELSFGTGAFGDNWVALAANNPERNKFIEQLIEFSIEDQDCKKHLYRQLLDFE